MSNNVKCEALGKYISKLYRQGNAFLTKKFNRYNIGSGQYMFLIQLYNHDGLSQEDLASQLNIDKGTTARAIKKLEDQGYITRVKDEGDKRANKIFLTQKAEDIRAEFFKVLRQWDDILTNGLTDEEIELASRLMKKISVNKFNNCDKEQSK